jgi:hypothetical protein
MRIFGYLNNDAGYIKGVTMSTTCRRVRFAGEDELMGVING